MSKILKSVSSLSILTVVLGAMGEASAANLVPNGDFSLGDTGFTTDYTVADGGSSSLYPEGYYYVGTNPALYHNLFTSYGDHTSGTGNMLIANGSPDTTSDVWRTASAITVTPNTLYYFEAWISSAHATSPAALTFALDGDSSDAILGVGSAPAVTGTWVPLSFTWDSGNNTSVHLFLKNANSAYGGNDFAIDDVYLGETTSIPVPDRLPVLGLLGVALLGVRRMVARGGSRSRE